MAARTAGSRAATRRGKAHPAAKPFLLTVLTGPNAGAEVRLADGTVTLGSEVSNDVILDDVAPASIRVALRGDVARIRPAAMGMTVNYASECPADRTTDHRLPIRLQLDGATAVHLCRTIPVRKGWTSMIPTAFVGIVACGLGMLATTQVDLGPPADAQILSTAEVMPKDAAMAVSVTEGSGTACAATCVTEAAADLRRMLDDVGLATIIVTEDAGVVRAGGTHMATEATAWSVVRRSYDEAWGARVPLVSVVSSVEPDTPFAVGSVWLGPSPELQTRAGQTYRIGDVTPEGWRVEAIAAGLIDVKRAGVHMQIAF